MSRSDQPFKSYGLKCALARKDFFVARCHFLAALYLNVSRPCATCRIMETRESVKKVQKNHVFEPRIGLHGGGLCPPPCSRTFASTLVMLQICGLIIVVDVDLVTLASLSRVKKSGMIQYKAVAERE